jgi:hypothetical protein
MLVATEHNAVVALAPAMNGLQDESFYVVNVRS